MDAAIFSDFLGLLGNRTNVSSDEFKKIFFDAKKRGDTRFSLQSMLKILEILNRILQLKSKKNEIVEYSDISQNKENIFISSIMFPPTTTLSNQRILSKMTIENKNPFPVDFNINPINFPKEFSFFPTIANGEINGLSKLDFVIEFKPSSLGVFHLLLDFVFLSEYSIFREAKIIVEDKSVSDILRKKSEYIYKPKEINTSEATTIIPGIPPIFPGPKNFVKKLPGYHVPKEIENAFIQKDEKKLRTFVGNERDRATYRQKYHNLLFVEELQMRVDIRKYDKKKNMRSERGFMILEVEGLAEKRPSVLTGDKVYARISNTKIEYEGFVHNVKLETLELKFDPSFHHQHVRGQSYDIRFSFNRIPIRRMHNAIDEMEDLVIRNILFPLQYPMKLSLPFNFFNRKLNRKQQQAVEMIIARKNSEIGAPYVIFGPPGTGKTITLVEAILQLWRSENSPRILACAPSNSAADLIALRLSEIMSPMELLRLNAIQRDLSDVPDNLLKFCKLGFQENLSKYKVIVTTCVSSWLIDDFAFSYVFIDEAGHALEPEALVSFASRLHSKSTLVLVGDPQQLGPIVRSQVCITEGLAMSLLERLTKFNVLYQKDPKFSVHGNYNPFVLTKLLYNYRSHPGILEIPNKLFYDGELIPSADNTHRYIKWVTETVRAKSDTIPIIFHGMPGKDEREGDSPSWFNTLEAAEVYNYILKLKSEKNFRPETIGVITPYHKQVLKIRELLNAKGFKEIKVGSVEEFQGQERDIMIISTVRSNVDNLGFDYKFNLGFLKNPKRFNVAVTRAKSLMIIIGNPFVLQYDPHWKQLLQYCIEKKVYVGCKFEFTEEKRIEEFLENDSDLISKKTNYEEPEWDIRN